MVKYIHSPFQNAIDFFCSFLCFCSKPMTEEVLPVSFEKNLIKMVKKKKKEARTNKEKGHFYVKGNI